jgi:hypothetical protein
MWYDIHTKFQCLVSEIWEAEMLGPLMVEVEYINYDAEIVSGCDVYTKFHTD